MTECLKFLLPKLWVKLMGKLLSSLFSEKPLVSKLRFDVCSFGVTFMKTACDVYVLKCSSVFALYEFSIDFFLIKLDQLFASF